MNLNNVYSFYIAVKHTELKRASAELEITTKALQIRLKKLEEDFGERLIFEENGKVQLTKRGGEFYTLVQKKMKILDHFEESLRGESIIRIGSSMAFSTYISTKLLNEFETRFWNVRFYYGPNQEMMEKLKKHELDMVISVVNHEAKNGLEKCEYKRFKWGLFSPLQFDREKEYSIYFARKSIWNEGEKEVEALLSKLNLSPKKVLSLDSNFSVMKSKFLESNDLLVVAKAFFEGELRDEKVSYLGDVGELCVYMYYSNRVPLDARQLIEKVSEERV